MITFTKRAFTSVAGAAVLASSLLSAPVSAETQELVFDVFIPRFAQLHSEGIVTFIQEVEAATGGTLKMTVPDSPMGPPPRIFDMVEDGIADLALVPVVYAGDRIKLPLILDIFAVAESTPAASVALWRTYEEFFADAEDWGAIMPVTLFSHADEQLFIKGSTATSLADLEGMKILAPSKLHAARIQALGAVPVGAPNIKMFEMISSGVAEGVISPNGPAGVQGLPSVISSTTQIEGGMGRPAFAIIMNRYVFEDLSPEHQAAIKAAGGEALAARMGAIADTEGAIGLNKFKDVGAEIVTAPDTLVEDMRTRLAFIEEQWIEDANATGIDGEAALAYFRSVLAEYDGS